MKKNMQSFDSIIGLPNKSTGFDYLRIGLSLSVLLVHCITIADKQVDVAIWASPLAPLLRGILPAFFALSGFLVAGSIFRNSIPQFIALRILRIVPALAVEITLCAIFLGGIFTTLPFIDYISNPGFYSYFLNIVGDIHYTLPGLFDQKVLNAQLWTIPSELECYIFLVIIWFLGLIKRKEIFLLLVVSGCIVATATLNFHHQSEILRNLPGRVLVSAFTFGVLIYLFKEAIPFSRVLLGISMVAAYLGLTFTDFVYLAAAPIAYVTIYVGLLRLPKIPFGDLSYGVYLFHFPIARTLDELSGHRLGLAGVIFLTILLTTLFAALSWKFVEHPVLQQKKRVLLWIERANVGLVKRLSSESSS